MVSSRCPFVKQSDGFEDEGEPWMIRGSAAPLRRSSEDDDFMLCDDSSDDSESQWSPNNSEMKRRRPSFCWTDPCSGGSGPAVLSLPEIRSPSRSSSRLDDDLSPCSLGLDLSSLPGLSNHSETSSPMLTVAMPPHTPQHRPLRAQSAAVRRKCSSAASFPDEHESLAHDAAQTQQLPSAAIPALSCAVLVPKQDTITRNGTVPSNPAERARKERTSHITCKAWAVVDMDSGAVLEEYNSSVRVSAASLTKIMSCLIVIEAAKAKWKILKSKVKVSARASLQGGTTANIKLGEVYTVLQLLYGMMLPSGNDAAVALAEHFGRLSSFATPNSAELSPYRTFVAKMNARAKELGLEDTHFSNPHGLFSQTHFSSAADMIELTKQANKISLFRKIVGTRRHSCRPEKKKARKKPAKQNWINTNQLLWEQGIDVWQGGKTGFLGHTHGQVVGSWTMYVRGY